MALKIHLHDHLVNENRTNNAYMLPDAQAGKIVLTRQTRRGAIVVRRVPPAS